MKTETPDWRDYFHFGVPRKDEPPGTLLSPDRNLRFTKKSSRIGLYPVRYHQAPDNSFPQHTHTFFEIFIVLSGRGNNVVEKTRFPIEAGDVVFVDNTRRHALEASKGGMDILNLCFLPSSLGLDNAMLGNANLLDFHDFLRPFKNGESNPKIHPPPELFSRLGFYAHHMCELFAEGDERNTEILRHLMRLILLLLLREYRKTRGGENPAGGAMLEAASWIQHHSSEKITLESLADRLGLNRTYFSTLFNRTFGKSLTDYVNEVRVHRAKELLAASDLPVARVALGTGFENKSHFHLVFRKVTGVTPQAWRDERRSR
ncbi:MAG: helix-turn-helix domain-containing protein [Spirochaetia bacterium]|nr:helix-turn-helix domain-containing protein [Spirochaetia bacterium]